MGNVLKKHKHNKKIKMYSSKKRRIKNNYNFRFKPEVVTITYYDEYGNKVINGDKVKYSYIYKGVPGGWYIT